MTSPAPLTETEKAAAQVLANHFNSVDCGGYGRLGFEEFAAEARAVVAAVRSSIEADALDALADGAADYGPPSADQIRAIGFMVRQGRTTVRDWLASDTALSLPASKETQQ